MLRQIISLSARSFTKCNGNRNKISTHWKIAKLQTCNLMIGYCTILPRMILPHTILPHGRVISASNGKKTFGCIIGVGEIKG